MSEPFPPTALQRHHAQTVKDSSSSYNIDYVIVIKTFLNPEGHQNRISGHFTVEVDFAYWWSFIGGGSAINGATPSSFHFLPKCNLQEHIFLVVYFGPLIFKDQVTLGPHIRFLYSPGPVSAVLAHIMGIFSNPIKNG